MIPAIILAGGASSRMGRPKALLPLPGGGSFLSRLEGTLRAAGVEEIVAVVGCDAAAIRAGVESSRLRLRLTENPDPARGQLSSLVVGLNALMRAVALPAAAGTADAAGARWPPAILVTPVDLPLVAPDTVRRVLNAWRESRVPIVRPARGGRHGHPVVFGQILFEELRQADPAAGARTVISAHGGEILDVAVDDPGAFDDIDTPADYERIVGSALPERL